MQAANRPLELTDLPAEMRQMIIDRMDSKSKCRFSQVSRICRKDAKATRNWVHSLVFRKTPDSIDIKIHHDKEIRGNEQWGLSYELRFQKERRTSYLICFDRREQELWKKKLDNSLDLFQYASSMFREVLEKFQKSVQKLYIVGWESEDLKEDLANLTNIESLIITNCRNLEDFLALFRRPLESFCVTKSDTLRQDIMQFEQIYHVYDLLELDNSNFDFNQFRRLSAANINIDIGLLTAENLHTILEEWKNNTWSNDPKFYKFNIIDSTFNTRRMLELFDKQHLNEEGGGFIIRHNSNNERKVECDFNTDRVLFYFNY